MGTKDQHRVRYDPAAVYDPTHKKPLFPPVGVAGQQRVSPTKRQPTLLPTKFPDDDKLYQPVRRVHVTRLQQNTLPPPSPSPSASPRLAVDRGSSSNSNTQGKRQRQRQRLANIADSTLWGFPVRYSPTQELNQEWDETAREQVDEMQRQRDAQAAEEKEQLDEERDAELTRQDYALYLYLASKYGAMDAILYCSAAFPGRLYALIVDTSVRKLQKWRKQRLVALRKYWVQTLAHWTVETSHKQGVALAVRAVDHQRRAAVFLKQLRWRSAASAFRSWDQYTQRQIEVKWRFQFSIQQDLRARFLTWKNRSTEIKAFKKQLKQVARRKQMQFVWSQWQEWQVKQHKVRSHLQYQWTKMLRHCMESWRENAVVYKPHRQAATCVQSQWRRYWMSGWFQRCRQAASRITKVAKGFLARRRVQELRRRLEIALAMEKIVCVLEWDGITPVLHRCRTAAVATELERLAREAQCVREAEKNATAFVTAELSKVRKNEMHHKLQNMIQELQTQGILGGGSNDSVSNTTGSGSRSRSLEALTKIATQRLVQQAVHTTCHEAVEAFRSQYDDAGLAINVAVAVDGHCVVCTISSGITMADRPWSRHPAVPRSPQCPHFSTLHAAVSTDVAFFKALYDRAIIEASEQDASIRQSLLQERVPIQTMLKLLHNNVLDN